MSPYDNSRHAALRRDQALRRLSTTTRWIVAGAACGAGVFTAIVAREIPGHSARAASTTQAGTSSSASSSAAPSTSATTGASGSTGIAASSGSTGIAASSGTGGSSGVSGASGSSQAPVAVSGGS